MTRLTAGRAGIPVLGVVALAVAGVMLVLFGATGRSHTAHAQPLPAHPFALAPSAARALPAPPTLTKPQHGSRQRTCTPNSGRPRVDLPALCIYASLVATSTDGQGALRIPADVHQVGLDLDGAPLDARRGTTIIAGHVDDAGQGDGAFYFLHDTQPGTPITVTGLDAAVTRWRVYEVTAVHKDALPTDIFTTTGARRLVLVTCGGALLHEPGHGNTYADNVLVYATPA